MSDAALSATTSWLVVDAQGALSRASPTALLGRIAALEQARTALEQAQTTASTERATLRTRVGAAEAANGAMHDQLTALKDKTGFACMPNATNANNNAARVFCPAVSDAQTCGNHEWCAVHRYSTP